MKRRNAAVSSETRRVIYKPCIANPSNLHGQGYEVLTCTAIHLGGTSALAMLRSGEKGFHPGEDCAPMRKGWCADAVELCISRNSHA
jgi:hypothetical protein